MKAAQLRTLIQDTLKPLALYSEDAEELLMATCAQESHLGVYRTQIGAGPGRGIFQDEGEDFTDLVQNYLQYHVKLYGEVRKLSQNFCVDDLVGNDPLAVAICRLHYYRLPEALPARDDIQAIWSFYKQHYNSNLGAAVESDFMFNYQKYCH